MNTSSLLLAIFLCLFLLITSKRYFIFPFIMAASCVPITEKVIFLGLDFTLLRMLVLAGILRLKLKGEVKAIQWNKFDKLVLIWALCGSAIYIIQQATFSSLVNRCGFLFDCLGMYWLFRQTLREWNDVYLAVRLFAVFAIITGPLIALEKFQNSSVFSLFGAIGGEFHRGRFRAAGPFPHSIMMGCFWALVLPFFYARIKAIDKTGFYWLACFSALSSVYFSASSTPIMTVGAVILFWFLYRYRVYGKTIFITTCCGLLFLHLIMKAPVWHLIARVDVFSGSTGYHRFFLIDNFLKNIPNWFWLGMKSTAHWGLNQDDITNQFILEGIRGGMITLVLFIMLIYQSVKIPGRISLADGLIEDARWMSWGICIAMLGNFVTFWGVSYFGQINMLLYFTFSLVALSLEHQGTGLRNALTNSLA